MNETSGLTIVSGLIHDWVNSTITHALVKTYSDSQISLMYIRQAWQHTSFFAVDGIDSKLWGPRDEICLNIVSAFQAE